MRRMFTMALTLILLLVAGQAAADLRIVTTTADLAAVAAQIGGNHARVSALALHTQDPHWVDARPHLALELSRADLLLAIGLDLEIGWLPTLQTGARNGDIQVGGKGYVDCSQFVHVLEVPTTKVDRSMGDVHPRGNPHYMFDPRQAAKVATGIAVRMGQLDPDNAAVYQTNAREFLTKLGKWQTVWEKKLAGLRGAQLVAYHKSFAYLGDWLGFSVPIHVEPRPGIPPNPGHVARVIAVAKSSGVPVILQESWYPNRTSRLIATKAGAQLVTIPGSPDFSGGQSYIGFVNEIVKKLAAATGGG
jgi:zinc/manganese transport system substrate-binding protein